MGKITTEMIEAVYDISRIVYNGKMTKKEASLALYKDEGMDRGSSEGYMEAFKKMMRGEEYNRTIKKEATNFFLTMILRDYGTDKLSSAINSVNRHISYYEKKTKSKVIGTR